MSEARDGKGGNNNGFSSLYGNVPLTTRSSVRLLHLLPGKWKWPIRSFLRSVALDSLPHYEALSYTWGSSSGTHKMVVNTDYRLTITNNLHQALRRLRKKSGCRIMWIDAICINQNDTEERGRQVAMMGEIYQHASFVNVWLGEYRKMAPSINLGTLVYRHAWAFTMPKTPRVMWSLVKNQHKALEMAISCSSPHWHDRAWVMQEFALAQRVHFCFGRHRVLYEAGWLQRLSRAVAATYGDEEFPNFLNFAHKVDLLEEVKNGKRDVQKPLDLLDITLAMHNLSATDPRDMVYSLLSLIAWDEASLIGSDYRLPRSKVYAKATFASIENRAGLDILNLVTFNDSRLDGVPTWAVDFEKAIKFIPAVYQSRGGFSERLRELRQPHLNASLDEGCRFLTIAGTRCDTVSRIWRLHEDYNPLKDRHGFEKPLTGSVWCELVSFVTRAASSIVSYAPDTNRDGKAGGRILLRQLHANVRIASEYAAHYIAALELDPLSHYDGTRRIVDQLQVVFKLWNDICIPKDTARKPAIIGIDRLLEFWVYARFTSRRLTLIAISSGLIGLATSSVAQGDSLVLVDSHCHFIVLRPTGSGHYTFRGFAYMHGVMDYQFWERWQSTGLEQQEFRLC